MNPFPNDFQLNTQLISDESLDDKDAVEAIRQLAERGFEVHTGLTEQFADSIADMCLEPAIKEYCPNDSGQRFTNRQAVAKWLQKGRAVFLLLKHDVTGDDLHLIGYGWAGAAASSHVPAGETTFALRVGEAGQGQRLAEPFSRIMLAAADQLYGTKNIWLETWASNGAAVHIYHKLGFTAVTEEPGERLTAAGETVPDKRIYMSLPPNAAALSSDSRYSAASSES
jgi:ribosomal protein S18 acetylase RimI-like enzyme